MSDFTKRHPGAPPGFFAVEAAGLRWLNVPGGAEVAEVLDVTDTSITLSRVIEARPTPRAAGEFGRRLAATHDAGADAFGAGPAGWDGDGYIGSTRLSLRPYATWGAFYAAERVLPYAAIAHRQGGLSEAGWATITALAARLTAGQFDDAAPVARIHGDLWAGNVLFTATSATLIDPAAQGGHRLTDLGMLGLFGLPYLEEVFDGYAAASAHLPPSWRQLLGLHQLHPLLVHAVLFGGRFADQAARIAADYR